MIDIHNPYDVVGLQLSLDELLERERLEANVNVDQVMETNFLLCHHLTVKESKKLKCKFHFSIPIVWNAKIGVASKQK